MGSGLLSMAICFNFLSTNIVQLSNRNLYFYLFQYHHPLITQLILNLGPGWIGRQKGHKWLLFTYGMKYTYIRSLEQS